MSAMFFSGASVGFLLGVWTVFVGFQIVDRQVDRAERRQIDRALHDGQ